MQAKSLNREILVPSAQKRTTSSSVGMWCIHVGADYRNPLEINPFIGHVLILLMNAHSFGVRWAAQPGLRTEGNGISWQVKRGLTCEGGLSQVTPTPNVDDVKESDWPSDIALI